MKCVPRGVAENSKKFFYTDESRWSVERDENCDGINQWLSRQGCTARHSYTTGGRRWAGCDVVAWVTCYIHSTVPYFGSTFNSCCFFPSPKSRCRSSQYVVLDWLYCESRVMHSVMGAIEVREESLTIFGDATFFNCNLGHLQLFLGITRHQLS